MSLWLILVVIGQFLNAIVALIDKYVVTSATVVLRPFTYAFWISVLSAGSIIIYFFSWIPIPVEGLSVPAFANIQVPTLTVFALSVTAGYAFFTALLSFFQALKRADASDAVPVIGGLTALFTLLLSYLFLNTQLPPNFMWGFMLLVAGTVLVSRFRFGWRTMLSVTHAGLMFGIHYIAFDALLDETNFDTAFFWSRLAIAAVALSMLLIPEYYEKIVTHTKAAHRRDGMFVLGNKVLAGFASIIILKAIEFSDSVALVQALGGLQYLFLLIISVFFGGMIARDFGENVHIKDIRQKAFAIPLIIIGFFLLFI